MSLHCSCDGGESDWYYYEPDDFSALTTKRSRKCCSCRERIAPGATVVTFNRYRKPTERCNYIEESIFGDEVPLADWFMCEDCGGLSLAVKELGMCFYLGDNLRTAIKEFNQDNAAYRQRTKEFMERMKA